MGYGILHQSKCRNLFVGNKRLVARIEAGKATIEREKERIADYRERLQKLEANDERP